jgi:hypothetical protein
MLFLAAAFLALVASQSDAQVSIPSGVFTSDKLAQAVERAKAGKKPLTLLQSSRTTTCGLCIATTGEIMSKLRSSTVVVFFENWDELPAPAVQIMNAADIGNPIPRAVIVDPDYKTLIGVIKYVDVKFDSQRTFSRIRKALGEYKGGGH